MSSAASSADISSAGPGPTIALVAGEASGDQLGAALMTALAGRQPNIRFVGVGGPLMQAAGLECWASSDELAVMGLFEVLAHLPRLLKLRRRLVRQISASRPDLLIGIDSPDFNLGLERAARKAGIRTAHYVSPTVWAWRSGRVRKIAASTDLVMCLFPFEPEWYAGHGVRAAYTGHPMADAIPLNCDRTAARERLSLVPGDGPVVALLPGSRRGEAERLSDCLLDAAARLATRYPGARFVAPMANTATREVFEHSLAQPGRPQVSVLDGRARDALAAADVVLCASGTAALEAMLVNRPMVVVYRLSGLTYSISKALRLVKSRFFSLPNILANDALVPELLQDLADGEHIALEAAAWLDQPERREVLRSHFEQLHRELRCDAAERAADCVLQALSNG